METTNHLLVFLLNNGRFALNLTNVKRVIPALTITYLPNAPTIVQGIIKLQEEIIPIVNIRQRLNMVDREIHLTDQIIISFTGKRVVGLLVDSVQGLINYDDNRVVPVEKILPPLQYVSGIVQLDDGLVIINDLDQFLSLDEENELRNALTNRGIKNG